MGTSFACTKPGHSQKISRLSGMSLAGVRLVSAKHCGNWQSNFLASMKLILLSIAVLYVGFVHSQYYVWDYVKGK
jgi:hypothetical protein